MRFPEDRVSPHTYPKGSVFPHTHITNNLPNHKSQWYMFPRVECFPRPKRSLCSTSFPMNCVHAACIFHCTTTTQDSYNMHASCSVCFGSFDWNPFEILGDFMWWVVELITLIELSDRDFLIEQSHQDTLLQYFIACSFYKKCQLCEKEMKSRLIERKDGL